MSGTKILPSPIWPVLAAPVMASTTFWAADLSAPLLDRHAIEHAERYQWRHGAAVAIGMVFAAELSRLTRSLSDAEVERHRRILSSLSLPTTYPLARWTTLLATMQRDKKARAGMLRFIVLDGVGRPTTLEGPDESLLFLAYQNVAEAE